MPVRRRENGHERVRPTFAVTQRAGPDSSRSPDSTMFYPLRASLRRKTDESFLGIAPPRRARCAERSIDTAGAAHGHEGPVPIALQPDREVARAGGVPDGAGRLAVGPGSGTSAEAQDSVESLLHDHLTGAAPRWRRRSDGRPLPARGRVAPSPVHGQVRGTSHVRRQEMVRPRITACTGRLIHNPAVDHRAGPLSCDDAVADGSCE